MKMAWKEIKKSKARFIILGTIVFLVSLLTFIISGLSNGLSHENAALIQDLPEGHFYMDEDADETYNFSKIDKDTQDEALKEYPDAAAFSIQMGVFEDENDKQQSVAYVAATDSDDFESIDEGNIILDESLQDEGIEVGDKLSSEQLDDGFTVQGFADEAKFSHSSVAFINEEDYKEMYHTDEMQLLYMPGEDNAPTIDGLVSFSNQDFLNTIPSYKAEQLSLNMIVWFLIVISGMLFGIFFYMMNVQKIGLYGILKAIGVKTSYLFRMMWLQMLMITAMALIISIALSLGFSYIAPAEMPFHLTIMNMTQLAGIFIVIGFIGATLSGIQIKKIEPLQAIQQGEM